MAKSMDTAAREALVMDLADYFRFDLTEADLRLYLGAIEEFDTAAVGSAVRLFISGGVKGRNNAFMPKPPEVGEQASRFPALKEDDWPEIPIERVPPGYRLSPNRRALIVAPGQAVPAGFVTDGGTVDFGAGRINLRGLSEAERSVVMKNHGRLPDGRNMAFMPPAEIKAAIAGQPAIEGKRRVVAKPRRMNASA